MAEQAFLPAEEAVLEKLREPDRGFPERVLEELASELDQDSSETRRILEKLEREGLTQSEASARFEERIWVASDEAADR